jgi:hypothetical protein
MAYFMPYTELTNARCSYQVFVSHYFVPHRKQSVFHCKDKSHECASVFRLSICYFCPVVTTIREVPTNVSKNSKYVI